MALFQRLFMLLSMGILTLITRVSSQGDWINLVDAAIWTDIGDSWTGSIPVGDSVWHYGPARLWATVVNSDSYVITSRIRASANGGQGCGHTFKYKQGSQSTQSLVTMAWGFYVTTDRLSISQSGTEYDPQINYPITPGQFHELKSVVNGTNVEIYVDDNFARKITMIGTGSDSATDNYVGLWCHARFELQGDSFQVQVASQCPAFEVDPPVEVFPEDCATSPMDINTNCSFLCPSGYRINGSSYTQCGTDAEWTSDPRLVSCVDIDECATSDYGGCSHKCVNAEGGYRCACPDPELSLASDNKTCHAPGVDVQCTQENMTITIPKSVLRGIHGEHLRLVDNRCTATDTGDQVFLTSKLNDCGTTRRYIGSTFVYSNKVLGISVDPQAIVTRAREIEIPFSCYFSRYGVVSSVGLKTSNTKLIFDDEGRGIFTMNLDMFPDGNFTAPYSLFDFPVDVVVPDPLFFQVSVISVDDQLSIRADRCYATPTQNSNDSLQYEIIRDGCPIDDTVVFYHDTPTTNVQRFRVDSFEFVNRDPFLFMHCEVMVCNASDPDSQCAAQCDPAVGRRKRAIGDYLDTLYTLAQGPIQLSSRIDHEPEQPSDITNDENISGSTSFVRVAPFLTWYVVIVAGTLLMAF